MSVERKRTIGFTCKICGRTFSNNEELLKHQATHTTIKRESVKPKPAPTLVLGESPFDPSNTIKCPYCGATGISPTHVYSCPKRPKD